jgi:hypothetical protein
VFERRFGGVPIITDEQFLTTASYIAHNPVAAGLCASAEQWRWGSHAAMTGSGDLPDWLAVGRLMSIYAERGGDPLAAYCRQVAARNG